MGWNGMEWDFMGLDEMEQDWMGWKRVEYWELYGEKVDEVTVGSRQSDFVSGLEAIFAFQLNFNSKFKEDVIVPFKKLTNKA